MSDTTTQTAIGLARGSFDCVSFDLAVEGRGTTGPKAKEEAQRIINGALSAALNSLAERDIRFEQKDGQVNFSVTQEFRYDDKRGRNVPSGYVASFSQHLETKDLDRAPEIMDVLTSAEGVNVNPPQFSLLPENRRKLQRGALEAAFKVVQERFDEECKVLNQDPGDFRISTWNARYNDRGTQPQVFANAAYDANMETLGGGPPDAPLVQSGLASVGVTLSVSYCRK